MFTIARLTFLEVFRKKVFMITLLLSMVFMLLYGIALNFVSQELVHIKGAGGYQLVMQQVLGNELLGSGLYFSSFLLALLALMASVGSIASEIENGLLHAIVSKPVKRREIVLGKFFGFGIMLTVYAVTLYVGVLALNLYYNENVFALTTFSNIIFGAFIYALQPLVLLGLAMVFSTLVRTLTAGIIGIILYGLGMVGGFLEQIGFAVSNANLINIGIATSLVMPSDALFRKLITVVTASEANPLSSLAMGPFGAAIPPSNVMLGYTCLYVVLCVFLAVKIFNKREL